jgi:uncharacterized protein (DUF1015 family)
MSTLLTPFRGVRYSAQCLPHLEEIMTPPYDVIHETERAAYMARSPYNMIHLILGAEYGADTVQNNRFTRAAGSLQEWRRQSVLVPEDQPALYLYQQEFTVHGLPVTRTGVISRVRLASYASGDIVPHEQTFAGPKADLLRLWSACQANLSLIFAVYADATHSLERLFAPTLATSPQREVQHWMEGQHRLWVVTDPATIAQAQRAMQDTPLVIADGHHRYETGLALREVMRQQNPQGSPIAPYDSVMMYCANIYDAGVVILPTHRLVQHLPIPDMATLLQQLPWIQTEVVPRHTASESLPQWQHRIERLLRERQEQGSVFALYAGGDSCYVITVSPAAAVQHVHAETASAAWKRLDVSVLHYGLLPALQACLPAAQPTMAYARAGDEVLDAVARGAYDLAVLMNPTPLQDMVQIARGGERMPPKSTYFYPKLPTGLVINCFDL